MHEYNRVFGVLSCIASLAKQLDITNPVRAAKFQRHYVIFVVPGGDALLAYRATTFLFCKKIFYLAYSKVPIGASFARSAIGIYL